ncbi:glycosyltransferase [Patulibacter sp. SYSU D01012]|uniref:glycosyltransferase family 2 protein n=1 Tax=Patulibacter sp. SYSU D01012 TaxID=2817381 RepID=UPI001B3087F3
MSGGEATPSPRFDVVVPTVGRATLPATLAALTPAVPRGLGQVLLVDDRPGADATDPVVDRDALPAGLGERVRILRSGGRGPAGARNVGWRAGTAPWVAFLDDDVLPPDGWAAALAADLDAAAPDVAGVQARLVVPRPAGRRPTDQERSDGALEDAAWATADMAYRREALEAATGFDERFPRAYREDADLALRLERAGWRLARGARVCVHPPRTAPWHASVGRQRGNADDATMRTLHGPDWRAAARVPRGRRRVHLATVAAGAAAAGLAAAGRPRAAALAAAGWAASTAQFSWTRIAPGPRTPRETAAMVATSALIPPAAAWHWARGWVRVARMDDRAPLPAAGPRPAAPAAADPRPAAAAVPQEAAAGA